MTAGWTWLFMSGKPSSAKRSNLSTTAPRITELDLGSDIKTGCSGARRGVKSGCRILYVLPCFKKGFYHSNGRLPAITKNNS